MKTQIEIFAFGLLNYEDSGGSRILKKGSKVTGFDHARVEMGTPTFGCDMQANER